MHALVKAEFRDRVAADADYYFCDAADCDVVYFSSGGPTFTRSQLTVEVGVKETTGPRPLCYCFGHSVESIKAELRSRSRTTAVEDIRARMAGPGCSCPTTNPSGSCCLGTVRIGIATANAELAGPGRGAGRGETVAGAGAVLSAVVSSSCCWLPLVLLGLGVSGAGIAGVIDAYRPAFVALTAVFLGSAFYFTYRPRDAAKPGHGRTPGGECCEKVPTPTGRVGRTTANKVALWGVAVLAVGFLLFPQYVRILLTAGYSSGPAATDLPIRTTAFTLEGMTCEGCAATVEAAARDVPGVLNATVDFDRSRLEVTSEACCPAPTAAVLLAVERAGFRGRVNDAGPRAPGR